jgi:type IV secretion system protein VirB1
VFLAAVALSQLIARCAPSVSPRTMSAVVAVESGGNPLALHDNTAGKSFAAADAEQAAQWASAWDTRSTSA